MIIINYDDYLHLCSFSALNQSKLRNLAEGLRSIADQCENGDILGKV